MRPGLSFPVERQTDTSRQTGRDRQRHRDRQKQRQRQKERHREGELQFQKLIFLNRLTAKQNDNDRGKAETGRQSEGWRERERTGRENPNRHTDRQKRRLTGRQRQS